MAEKWILASPENGEHMGWKMGKMGRNSIFEPFSDYFFPFSRPFFSFSGPFFCETSMRKLPLNIGTSEHRLWAPEMKRVLATSQGPAYDIYD